MACKQYEIDNICSFLENNSTPLRIWTVESLEPEFYLPRCLMENVSPKLATICSQGHQLVNLSHEVLFHFVTWLLYRKIDLAGFYEDETLQTQLAQAWNFGAEYDVPAFQNRIMQELLKLLRQELISKKATIEAYRPKERGTLLQKAFVLYLASEMNDEHIWSRDDFTGCVLGEDPTFILDLTLAVSEGFEAAGTDRECYMSETSDDED